MVAVVLLLAPGVQAQQLIASHGDWRVFTIEQNGDTICYIASLPVKKEGNYSKRDEPYLLVTHKRGPQDEVSVSSGYPYKKRKDVKLSFGQKSFELFVKDELAWAYDEAADRAIVKEMIRGSTVAVHGTSWKGTTSKDTYSLKGFTDAHRDMKRLCN